MGKMKPLDRVLLLFSGAFAAYLVVEAVDGMPAVALAAYTAAFGMMLVAVLLLVIVGPEILDSPLLEAASVIIPLCLSVGLVSEYLPEYLPAFILPAGALVLAAGIRVRKDCLPLGAVQAVGALLVFGLSILLSVSGRTHPGFILFGAGGLLLGAGGMLVSSLNNPRPLLPQKTILSILPVLIFLSTAFFALGFHFG
jgi:hypothetical protein